jgi:hypothetical protein
MAPPAYEMGMAMKPPRPNVMIAGIVTMVGGLLLIVGALVPWLTANGESVNGLDTYFYEKNGDLNSADSPGSTWIFCGIVLLGLGLTLVLAKRVLPVAIVAIVFGGLSLLFVFGSWAIASDSKTGDIKYGAGLIVGTLGAAAAIAGSIMATAKRRRAA